MRLQSYLFFAVFLVMALPLDCAAQGEEPRYVTGNSRECSVGGLVLRPMTQAEPDMPESTTLHVLRQDREFMEPMESWMMDAEIIGPDADVPWPGCAMIMASTYTGGAHCCFEELLLVSCEWGELAARVYLANSTMGELTEMDGKTVMALDDWGFAYYSVPTDDPGQELFLPFAASPAMTRFLVLEPRGIRLDLPGEFRDFHMQQWQEFAGGGGNANAADALTAAYHAYMATGDPAVVRQELQRSLPEDWMAGIDTMSQDVVYIADRFFPVESHFFPK